MYYLIPSIKTDPCSKFNDGNKLILLLGYSNLKLLLHFITTLSEDSALCVLRCNCSTSATSGNNLKHNQTLRTLHFTVCLFLTITHNIHPHPPGKPPKIHKQMFLVLKMSTVYKTN